MIAPKLTTGTPTDEVVRLSMGVLLHTLVENMEAAMSGAGAGASAGAGAAVGPGKGATPNGHLQGCGRQPRMYMYSGHDSTIMPLLAALGADVETVGTRVNPLQCAVAALPLQHASVRWHPAQPLPVGCAVTP